MRRTSANFQATLHRSRHVVRLNSRMRAMVSLRLARTNRPTKRTTTSQTEGRLSSSVKVITSLRGNGPKHQVQKSYGPNCGPLSRCAGRRASGHVKHSRWLCCKDDRRRWEDGDKLDPILYAAVSKRAVMKIACPRISRPPIFRICPFRIIAIASKPANVLRAVRNPPKPSPGRTRRLMRR